MMEMFNGKIAVTVAELTDNANGNAVMSKCQYDNGVKRAQITVLRKGGNGRKALIEYNSLPERFQQAYVAKYGDPHEMTRDDKPHLAINDQAREYFAGATTGDGKHLSAERIEEYTINASVLDLLRDALIAQRAGRKRLNNSTPVSWDGIWATSESLRESFGHTLPGQLTAEKIEKQMKKARNKDEAEGRAKASCIGSLQKKIKEYIEEGFECLISKKLGNSNTLKIPEEGGKLMIALRRSKVPIYTEAQIFEEYNRRAVKKGWKPLQSPNTVKQYLHRPEIEPKWWAAVYGELAAAQRFDRKHKTVMPERRDSLWYGDGTKLNLYFKGRDKNGKPAKMTAMVYEVVDAYSEMLLGYAIGAVENSDLQRRAFRMAIERAGYKPYEIVTDNQGGQKKNEARAFMSKICRASRTTQPHQPQAKSIEQIFGRFQRQVLHSDWRFTGQNMTATSRDSHINKEFIEDNYDNLYTYEEMCAAYAEYRERWNDRPHPRLRKPRREVYFDSVNPECERMLDYDIMDAFWRDTEMPSEFTASGITVQVDKRSYTYEVFDENGLPDMAFRRKYTGQQFFVKYDPDDMTQVWLCTKTSIGMRRIRKAQPYAVVHRAIQDQTTDELMFIRTMTEANKHERIARQMEGYQFDLDQGIAPEQHGLRSSRIRGISRRDQERISDEYFVSVMAAPEWQERCEPVGVGEDLKMISNMTYEDIEANLISKF